MDSVVGGFELPISAMNIFNNISILILVCTYMMIVHV